MKTKFLVPEFVELMPQSLKDGIVYVSMEYGTVIHNCCCGCGNKVVTPLSPTDWKLMFDGENISISPSIGNWSFPCQSHYWIRGGKVEWSGKFSKDEIDEVRKKDKDKKLKHFEKVSNQEHESKIQLAQVEEVKLNSISIIFRKFASWFH